jgi:hypothetical protein
MPDPQNRKWAGVCWLCGSDLWTDPHLTRVEDAPDVFIPGSSGIHNCVPGRILHEQGGEAYEAWRDKQTPGTYMSMEELEAELERFEAESSSTS